MNIGGRSLIEQTALYINRAVWACIKHELLLITTISSNQLSSQKYTFNPSPHKMQLSTFFATTVALAAGANASVIKGRQEALATLEAYNFSTCDVDSVLTVEIVDQECHDFDHGYGNAQATLTDPEKNCMRECCPPPPKKKERKPIPYSDFVPCKSRKTIVIGISTNQTQCFLVTLYSEEGCNGEIYFQKPGTCNKNIDGLARFSYALTCA